MIQKERIRPLHNEAARTRDYVVYWMQSSQLPIALDVLKAKKKAGAVYLEELIVRVAPEI